MVLLLIFGKFVSLNKNCLQTMKQILSCLESDYNLYNLTYNVEEDNDRRFWFLTETAVEVIGKKSKQFDAKCLEQT